jgi:hypothetical protein
LASPRPTRADATRAYSSSASIVAGARIVMSLADDADKLFDRVHGARRFALLARFRDNAVSILGNGLGLLAKAARPFEHPFL